MKYRTRHFAALASVKNSDYDIRSLKATLVFSVN